MTELDIPEPPSNATSDTDAEQRATPPSRCDNYENYLEDTLGYAYGMRDIVELERLESHDQLRDDLETLEEAPSLEELDDLERLGLARGLQREGNVEGFTRIIDVLLRSEEEDPGVAYPELPLFGAIVMIRAGDPKQAADWLDRGLSEWPDRNKSYRRLKGRVLLSASGAEVANEHYEELVNAYPEDPELPFEIAEDFAAHGASQWAERWLEHARSVAERLSDRSILVDIEVLANRLADASRE